MEFYSRQLVKDDILKSKNLNHRIHWALSCGVWGLVFIIFFTAMGFLVMSGFAKFAVADETNGSLKGSQKGNHLFVDSLGRFPTLTLTEEVNLQQNEEKTISGQWWIRVRGRHFVEKQNSFSGTEFSFLSAMKYQLVPSLSFKLKSKVGFKNDHVQLEYRDEYSEGHFQVYEAVAEITPESGVFLQVGAIHQKPYSSPIFVYEHSLPGVSEKIEYQMGDLTFMVYAQQTLATAKSFSAERSEAAQTPVFNREILGMTWERASRWQLKAYASHFMFNHLAAVTAADGSKLGHFTLGSGAAAQFRYEFAGLTAQTEVSYNDPSGIQISAGGFWLTNQEAKVDGQGQSLYLQSSFPMRDYKLSFSYMNFFKEREAAPAVFSDLSLGGNNRMGNRWGFQFGFEKLGFKIVGQLLDVDVIKASEGGRRGRAHSYYLGLETLNVQF